MNITDLQVTGTGYRPSCGLVSGDYRYVADDAFDVNSSFKHLVTAVDRWYIVMNPLWLYDISTCSNSCCHILTWIRSKAKIIFFLSLVCINDSKHVQTCLVVIKIC